MYARISALYCHPDRQGITPSRQPRPEKDTSPYLTFDKMNRAAIFLSLALVGCDFLPEKVQVGDARLRPMWEAARSFDRLAYGFSPLPDAGDIRLETRPRAGYDAMLHIYTKTSRTIAFRKTQTGYRWIGEQESFEGPKQYTTVDGTFYEQIVLTFDLELLSGSPTNQLAISYWGEDSRLAGLRDLQLGDVQPILKEWGY